MKRTSKGIWALSFVLVLGFFLALFFSTPALADNPAGVIAYRQKVMGAKSGHLGAIGQILKHGLSYTGHIEGHAKALVHLAGLLEEVFPEGTGKGKTDALPEIWSDRDGFLKAARKLKSEASNLVKVAGSGDRSAIGAQVKKVGKSCGGCHKNYRQPKKKRYAWKK